MTELTKDEKIKVENKKRWFAITLFVVIGVILVYCEYCKYINYIVYLAVLVICGVLCFYYVNCIIHKRIMNIIYER